MKDELGDPKRINNSRKRNGNNEKTRMKIATDVFYFILFFFDG